MAEINATCRATLGWELESKQVGCDNGGPLCFRGGISPRTSTTLLSEPLWNNGDWKEPRD